MIQAIVDFALRQCLAVLAAALVLVALGTHAFVSVPIEAYPDVGDTQVQLISQWPGHAAQEGEREVTIPLERALNAVPHQVSMRSISSAGLSVVTVTFADGTSDYLARTHALERLAQANQSSDDSPALGPLASPIGEVCAIAS